MSYIICDCFNILVESSLLLSIFVFLWVSLNFIRLSACLFGTVVNTVHSDVCLLLFVCDVMSLL